VPERFAPGFLQTTDRRYRPARIVAERLQELHEALGGADALSPQQKSLCERVVWLGARLQQLEQEFLAGQGLDAPEYTALVGSLTSVYRLLGLYRKAKPVETLAGYAQRIAQGVKQ
jgi:hypothetical protein